MILQHGALFGATQDAICQNRQSEVSWRRALRLVCLIGLLLAGGWCRAAAADEDRPLPQLSQRYRPAAERGNNPGDVAAPTTEVPNFQRHVVPLLGRLGCNGRSCHGSFQGQGGFRLSMFGYDFAADRQALVDGTPPRANVKEPDESLILNKPTSDDDHGGGKRYDKSGWEYQVLRRWIEAGAPDNSPQAGTFLKLELTPAEITYVRAGQQTQITAIAHWSDGTREDVTCLTRFSSADDTVADVEPSGLVTAKAKGDTYIIACYDNGVQSTEVVLPVSPLVGDKFPLVPTTGRIDELVLAKLRRLGLVPSDLAGDEEFLRRVSLDIAGSLPTPEEVRSFAADASPDKRARKIDELLERPAYVTWWTTRMCDLLGLNAPLYLGNTEFGPIVGDQWLRWVERRVRENVGYDQMVRGILLSTSREPGQSYREFALAQSRYTRKVDPADFTAQDQMPHFWFRGNLGQPEEKALAVAYSFFGVRLDCAQCHKHPFDQWTQQDFQQFTRFFERVRTGVSPECKEEYDQLRTELGVEKMKNAAERRTSYWRWAAEGKAVPWPEVYIADPSESSPKKSDQKAAADQAGLEYKLLGGRTIKLEPGQDPREPLLNWMLEKDHPYLSRALVNRVWAWYFGRGIVDPPDDHNLANPPSNKALLDYLARSFVEHGYDLKWLHREIANSRTYQLSWVPTDSNRGDERNFSHSLIRRLPAEVAVDAILQATSNAATLAKCQTEVKGRRIGVQPTADDRRTEFALVVLGKPLRTINCDCERSAEPSLLQSIYLRNDVDQLAALDRKEGWLAELLGQNSPQPAGKASRRAAGPKPAAADKAAAQQAVGSEQSPAPRAEIDQASAAALFDEAYLRTLSRHPTEAEAARCSAHLKLRGDLHAALHDIVWALLNTQEFITNH